MVLFGPNNAGKSNILSAIDRLLGERHPTYIEMLDSDFYMRNKALHPTSTVMATFTSPYYYDRYGKPYSTIAVTYGYGGNPNEHLLHDGHGQKLFISSENRSSCQSYLIDAERNIQSAFNYSSKYSLLSKFSHKIHQALSSEHKEQLSAAFNAIKTSFEETQEFSGFFKPAGQRHLPDRHPRDTYSWDVWSDRICRRGKDERRGFAEYTCRRPSSPARPAT